MEPTRDRRILLSLLEALQRDINNIQQKGAGYYSCQPFVDKYNKLLEKTRVMFGESSLLDTFVPVEATRSVDPTDKIKTTQEVLIELGQLITFVQELLAAESEAASEGEG